MEMEFSHEKIFSFTDDAYDDRARFLASLGMTGSEG
jgi:hypothetical protein